MTAWLAVAAIVLAALSVVLFVLALRRLLSRQADVTAAMLRRYDDRLAGFAQTLNDALTAVQSARAASPLELESDPEPMVRALELARERTSADGAIALVSGAKGTPIVATVGLSESETNHIARMGFPDYRGARAIEVGFAGDLVAPDGEEPVRAGLVVPLLDENGPQSLLGVLTRDRDRRFSEEDVDGLHELVQRARPPISRSLDLSDADVVPELDMLTSLLDRQSFAAVLEREILRARLAHHPLSLLVMDVDRLTWLNARIGILAADGVLLELAKRLQAVTHRLDYAFRLGGGKFAVLRPGSEGGDARELFDALRTSLENEPIGEAGHVSVSGGITELLPQDDRETFAARAEASLAEAKDAKRGTAVVTGDEGRTPKRNGTLHQLAPGEIVLEG
jgi:diguanylate cyclase (GGDEF)-like protein